MPKFSSGSLKKLAGCHDDLQKIFKEVIKHYDCSVIDGFRDEYKQNYYYQTRKTKLIYPHSKHNKHPSLAVDVVPYPINWDDRSRFYHFAGFVLGVAKILNIEIIWGGDWDSDTMFNDQNFHDLPHFELIIKK